MKQRYRKFAGIIILLLLAACGIENQMVVERLIVLPEDRSMLDRLRRAEIIGMKMWESDLTSKIIVKFPMVTKEDLDGLFVRWGKSEVIDSSLMDKESISTEEYVFIKVGIVHKGNLANGEEIADYMAGIVNSEMAK